MDQSETPFPAEWRWPNPSLAALRLAAALAQRLDAVVPRPLRVEAEGDVVSLYRGAVPYGGTGVAPVFDQEIDPDAEDAEQWSFAERAARVAWNALNGVQDGVAEATAEPWPRLPGGGMASPGTRADGGQVFLWYGPSYKREDGAVVSLPPITLDDLVGPG